MMDRLLIFILLSIPVIAISWRTIFKPTSHGFYRFISWECIIWLIVNNIRYWFIDPFSWYQIIAWILLIYSLVLIIPGVLMMKKMGKPMKNRGDKSLYSFEQTSELIESGIFKYIRHPLYGSLLFLTWGIFFKNPELSLFIIGVVSTTALFITVKIEEEENITFFGDQYRQYMKKSKMFIPYLF